MPEGVWNLEWLNANSQRRYPLTDDSSAADDSGAFTMPNSFLLYLDFPVHQGLDVDPSRFFLYQLGSYANGYQLVLGYLEADNTTIVPVATALISSALHTPGTRYALGGVGDFADSMGAVVIGKLDEILQQPPGLFTFSLANSRIEPDGIRPIVRGISSLAVLNGSQVSNKLYGDIILVAEKNMQLTVVDVGGQPPEIHFSAINGEGTVGACVCVGDTTVVPIQFINDLPPTPDGRFYLLGSECVSFAPIDNGLKLTDTCSQPCCDCRELASITAQLEQFGIVANTLQNFLNRLESSVNTMSTTVLGSRLNDRGCGA